MVLSTLHLIAKPNSGLQMVPHPGNPASSWPGSEPARSDVQESDDEDYFKLLGCTVKVWGPLIQTAFNCGPSG